jgi:hypothetical protein
MNEQALFEWNRRVYDSPDVAEIYAPSFVRMGLLPAEKLILFHLGARILGRSILDLGGGGGRIAPHLHDIASR